jgi:4-amino-4-deoxy-L-arabinose transferase-like glycosyltransferase
MHRVATRAESLFNSEVNRVMVIAAVGVGLRLVHLDADLWEKHSWRQAEVAMIASNFYHNGFNILYPQVNWGGNMPGYVGTEFPLVSFIIAVLYSWFGEQLILGRLVSIGFFCLSVPFFYLLVRRYFGLTTAGFALFFYVVSPLSVFYTRTLMPESAMLCFSIGSLYFFSSWIDDPRNNKYFLLATLFTTLALLVKIPMAVLGLPLGYLAFTKHRWSMFRQNKLWLFAFVVLLPSILWYQHAFWLAATQFPFKMFGSRLWLWDGGHGAVFDVRAYLKLGVQASLLLLTPLGLLMAVGGLLVVNKNNKATRLFHWWCLGLLVHVMVCLAGHSQHEYYQLPFVPVAATFAGAFAAYLVSLPGKTDNVLSTTFHRRAAMAVLSAIIVVMSVALLATRYRSQPEQLLFDAGRSVDLEIPANALIVAWAGRNSTLIYASRRRGWHFPDNWDFQRSLEHLEELRGRGAAYFVAPLRPASNPESVFFIREMEAAVRRTVLGIRESSAEKYLGGLRLFDRDSKFGAYLVNHYRKIFQNQFVAIYDLSSRKAGRTAARTH